MRLQHHNQSIGMEEAISALLSSAGRDEQVVYVNEILATVHHALDQRPSLKDLIEFSLSSKLAEAGPSKPVRPRSGRTGTSSNKPVESKSRKSSSEPEISPQVKKLLRYDGPDNETVQTLRTSAHTWMMYPNMFWSASYLYSLRFPQPISPAARFVCRYRVADAGDRL